MVRPPGQAPPAGQTPAHPGGGGRSRAPNGHGRPQQPAGPRVPQRPPARPKPSSIPESFLASLRERAQITDLFPRGALKKRGSEFLTLCPCHADTNASLTVSPRTNRVHCFVCARGTDAIGWLQDRLGLTFAEAVRELAGRYGMALPHEDPEARRQAEALRREQQRLLAWRERQQKQFHQALLDDIKQLGPAAIALGQRGLTVETAIAWGLGLNGNRLMLPLRDALGRCVAFSGRSLNGEEPKYRHSPGDALFRKGEMLFGLDRAMPAIRRNGEVLLVEGPIDAIQLHQVGLDHAVASLGTTFSLEQAQRLLRCGARRLWIAYDGDAPGQDATARVVSTCRGLAMAGQVDLLVATLPAGEDPDSLLRRQGQEALRGCLSKASHWLEWEVDQILSGLRRDPQNLSLLQAAERQGAELVALLPEGVLRQRAQDRLSRAVEGFSVPAPAGRGEGAGKPVEISSGPPAATEAILQAERRALRLYLHNPEMRELLAVLEFSDPLHREAMGCLVHLERRWRGDWKAPQSDAEGDGLRELVLLALPALDPPLVEILAPMARGGELLRRMLLQHGREELGVVLGVLEGEE